jgi:hypothetical protein
VLVIQNRLQHRIAAASPQTPTVDLRADAGWSAVQFTAVVGNPGNTVVGHQAAPTPVLTLYNLMPWADPALVERTIPVRGFYVAPESARDLWLAWTDPPIIGHYRAVFTPPAAHGQPHVVAETTFIAVNLPVLSAIVLVPLIVMTLVTVWLVRRRRSTDRAI